MGKYTDIVNGSWVDMTLYAESIPHLLHWDLAYFWILEKEHLRPESWEEKVDAWRYLAGLFILGELEVEDEPIHTPFLEHTLPYGITKVSWLRFRNTQQRVGVLSPTVLVRPLPDFKDADLKQWVKTIPDPAQGRGNELSFFTSLITKSLLRNERGDSFRVRLAKILEREFKPATMANPPSGDPRHVQVLTRIFWAQEPDGDSVEDVEILVKRGAGGAQRAEVRSYIPRCSSCGNALTRVSDAPPIVVTGEQFQLDCKECGTANSLELSQFLIWLRGRNGVVVWRQEGVLAALNQGSPPAPVIQSNIDLMFEWERTQLNGEMHRRFLRLRFPDKNISQHKLEEIFYTQVLVPGNMAKFTGLPVRAQWADAVADPYAHTFEADAERRALTYRGLSIKGWPEPLRWSFVNLKTEPALALGVYPNPQKMHEDWQLYRTFLAGAPRRAYRLSVDSTREILPWLREGEVGAPEIISATDKKNENAGVTYWQGRAVRTQSARVGHRKVYVGIDLGTTNTLVYSMSVEQKESKEKVNAKKHGVRPSDLHRSIGWIAEAADAQESDTIGDFLPGATYGERKPDGTHRTDPYIIPSALWEFEHQHLIRWSPELPIESAEPKSDFKLGTSAQHLDRRRAFSRELFWVALPHILMQNAQSVPAHFHIGFAFPLAFDHRAREERIELMKDLGRRLGSESFRFDFYWTDESNACVRAFGSPNPDDVFLVADMGGGTTDLALVKGSYVMQLAGEKDWADGNAESVEPLQIGSVEFAGGDFVRALVSKKYQDEAVRERFYWELRDLISRGECDQQYGSDTTAQIVLNRLTGAVFEFLHTMVAALLPQGEQFTEIRLVLVGNGWHLIEAFSTETARRGGRHVFNQYYNALVKYITPTSGSLKFFNPKDSRLESLPSSKHLVVIGALENVVEEEGRGGEFSAASLSVSKLPAGREMHISLPNSGQDKDVNWYDLVGEDVPWEGFTDSDLRKGTYTFDLERGPGRSSTWYNYLLGLIGNRDRSGFHYPTDMDLKRAVIGNIQGNPPKLFKGPLQLILEGSWKEKLED